MIEVKDEKVELPVIEPRAAVSQMWLYQFPRYIISRQQVLRSQSHENFPAFNGVDDPYRTADQGPFQKIEVYLEEDRLTRYESSGSRSFLAQNLTKAFSSSRRFQEAVL